MVDAKERKRKRDKERYDAMSVEQKNEKNKNRREARQRNKALSIKPNSSRGDEKLNSELLYIPPCPYYTKLTCSIFVYG